MRFGSTFSWGSVSSMVVLAPQGSCKTVPVVRLATHKLLVSVDAVIGVKLLVTTVANKHMATVLQSFVLIWRWQTLESLVTDITWHLFFKEVQSTF